MPYTAAVFLRVDEADAPVKGEMHNLSRRGMYVRMAPQPPLGTEVMCQLPGSREVRGRVAWTFNAAMPANAELDGVGIQFVDVSTDSMIDDLIGAHVEEGHPLKVWFAGMSSNARAIGRVTPEGIELSTTLEFLRLGSEISIAPSAYADGARMQGAIKRVSLRTDGGAPRLSITLAMGAEISAPAIDTDDARWFPEIIVESEHLHAAPTMLVEPENTERTPFDLAPVLEPIPMPRSPSLRAPLTVAATLLLIGLIVLRVGFPASEQPAALPPAPVVAAEPVAAEPVAAEPVAIAPPVVDPIAAPAAAATVVAAPEHAPIAIAPSPAPATGDEWKPTIALHDGQPSIVVPFSGSPKGHETFSLDDPPGVFIDLPIGKAAVPMRSYLFHDDADFRSLWVRARPKGGLQVRLHVAKGVRVAIDIEGGTLRFRKKAPTP